MSFFFLKETFVTGKNWSNGNICATLIKHLQARAYKITCPSSPEQIWFAKTEDSFLVIKMLKT